MTIMKKGNVGPLIFTVIVLSTLVLVSSFFFVPRSTSWIGEVENKIREENWEPDREYIPLMLDAFFLYENGEEEFFYLYSHHEFVSYIIQLENKVNRKINNSITEEFLDEVLASNKVLQHNLRLMIPFRFYEYYENSYFILEDNLEMGLEGTIIFQHSSFNPYESYYAVWEIADWIL
jgi:hypothetical protein